MRRRELLIGGGTVAAATLAGCTSRGDPGENENPDANGGTIAVTGRGEASAEPDLAQFMVGIESRGENPEAVRSEVSERESAVRDALIDVGVDADDITTSRFRIRERHEERHSGSEYDDDRARERSEEEDAREAPPERVTYYDGAHELAVETEDVDRIGEVLDAAIDGGADHVGGVQFTLQDETREALREEALSEAIANGRAEANHIAGEIGQDVQSVKQVDSSSGGSPIARYQLEAADDAGYASTEIHPDDVSVGVSVDMVVTIG